MKLPTPSTDTEPAACHRQRRTKVFTLHLVVKILAYWCQWVDERLVSPPSEVTRSL